MNDNLHLLEHLLFNKNFIIYSECDGVEFFIDYRIIIYMKCNWLFTINMATSPTFSSGITSIKQNYFLNNYYNLSQHKLIQCNEERQNINYLRYLYKRFFGV